MQALAQLPPDLQRVAAGRLNLDQGLLQPHVLQRQIQQLTQVLQQYRTQITHVELQHERLAAQLQQQQQQQAVANARRAQLQQLQQFSGQQHSSQQHSSQHQHLQHTVAQAQQQSPNMHHAQLSQLQHRSQPVQSCQPHLQQNAHPYSQHMQHTSQYSTGEMKSPTDCHVCSTPNATCTGLLLL
jgi:chromosome segregation ATPase